MADQQVRLRSGGAGPFFRALCSRCAGPSSPGVQFRPAPASPRQFSWDQHFARGDVRPASALHLQSVNRLRNCRQWPGSRMPKHNLLDTRTVNYLELIGNGRRYQVPPYQRDYSWTEEQWEDLWNDMEDLRAQPDERHYLGSLVIEGISDREFQVIDGQQRLATLSLFALAVIARLLAIAEEGVETEENRKRAAELRNRYLGEKDPASLLESSRLNLNEVDDPFYQDYLIQLQSPPNLRRLPRSNQLLWGCFRFYADRLQRTTALRQDGTAVARLLSETVARQLLFILITVDDELSAYTVIETLNARGMNLTTTDLLKNYLFSRIPVGADRKVSAAALERVGRHRGANALHQVSSLSHAVPGARRSGAPAVQGGARPGAQTRGCFRPAGHARAAGGTVCRGAGSESRVLDGAAGSAAVRDRTQPVPGRSSRCRCCSRRGSGSSTRTSCGC